MIIIYFFISHILMIICYLILGMGIPAVLNIEIPGVFFFSWIIGPVGAMLLTSGFLEYVKVYRIKLCLILSFILNFSYTSIYTWYEIKQPPSGDFLDFRGLIFMVMGIGQIVGIISSLFCKEPERKINS